VIFIILFKVIALLLFLYFKAGFDLVKEKTWIVEDDGFEVS